MAGIEAADLGVSSSNYLENRIKPLAPSAE